MYSTLKFFEIFCIVHCTIHQILDILPQRFMVLFFNLFSMLQIKLRGRYVSEIKTTPCNPHKTKLNLIIGEPFEINYFYNTLADLNAEMSFKSGRQEDAQEFLSFLLNRLHDEMVKCLDSLNTKVVETEVDGNDDTDWNLVGKKNRSHITRKVFNLIKILIFRN